MIEDVECFYSTFSLIWKFYHINNLNNRKGPLKPEDQCTTAHKFLPITKNLKL